MEDIKAIDSEIYELIKLEEKRQYDKIRLIASENYVSSAVLQATGSILTNKYSEGYAGKRYYEGQQIIDQVENLAIDNQRGFRASSKDGQKRRFATAGWRQTVVRNKIQRYPWISNEVHLQGPRMPHTWPLATKPEDE